DPPYVLLAGEHEIELAPVFLRRRALRRPARRVVQLIGHVRRPEAAQVAVEDVALDRLTETGGAAGRIGFPAWRERERASKRNVRLRRRLLQRDDVAFFFRLDVLGHAMRLAVD